MKNHKIESKEDYAEFLNQLKSTVDFQLKALPVLKVSIDDTNQNATKKDDWNELLNPNGGSFLIKQILP